jgi:uncharacterized protein YyaL (SSP411 family)
MNTNGQPNRLIHEKSPYLLQHAYNPVNWYTWGEEALERAKREKRPIFLSVGYSACHWCHVMERETFEDNEIAKLLEEYFISIKVDREERPDIDEIYQRAAQILTGSGGWPLTVFLTPDQKPFYAGTYFPPEDKYGRPGFKRVVTQLGELWSKEEQRLREIAQDITEAMVRREEKSDLSEIPMIGASESPLEESIKRAINSLKNLYDSRNGGFGTTPKFPNVNILTLFLQRSTSQPELEKIIENTLTNMASGGIYDQLGGGFHRYSTDEKWLVPHFEKMLYDNALLASLYLNTYKSLGAEEFRIIGEGILNYVLRDMTHPEGGFYATEDADSEGQEGKFYVWQQDEVIKILGKETGDLFCYYYAITPSGNFEKGLSILYRPYSLEEVAKRYNVNIEQALAVIEEGREKLFKAREERIRPFRDEKIITSWNGMMITAMAQGGRFLGNSQYINRAKKAADFILTKLTFEDGTLIRNYKAGPSNIPGFLEDYAYFTAGLIDLYYSTFEDRWLKEALRLMDLTIELFWSEEASTFFDLSRTEDRLIIRPCSPMDQSFPSGLSITAMNLLRLSPLGGERMSKTLNMLLTRYNRDMELNPWGFATLWSVATLYNKGLTQVVATAPMKAGEDSYSKFRDLLQPINETYIPDLLLFGPPMHEEPSQVWQGKEAVQGQPTLYICRDFACSPPFTDPDTVREHLKEFLV